MCTRADPTNVVDFGYPVGSIQVPSEVEPIVLVNDPVTDELHATFTSVCHGALARTKTNDKTRFRRVELAEALRTREAP